MGAPVLFSAGAFLWVAESGREIPYSYRSVFNGGINLLHDQTATLCRLQSVASLLASGFPCARGRGAAWIA